MRWVNLVSITDLLTACSLAILFLITLRKRDKSLVDWLLAGLLFFQFCWVFLDGLAVFLAVYFGIISDVHGGFIGLAIIGIVLFILLLSEYFPDHKTISGHRIRVTTSLVTSLPFAVLVFTPYWIYNRRVVDGIKIGDHGLAFYGLTGWVVIVLASSVVVLYLKSKSTRDLRTRRNLRFLLVGILGNMVLSLSTVFFLPILGIFRFDFVGPVVSLLFISTVLYTMNFHSLFDIQKATYRFILHLLLGIFLCAIVFGAVHVFVPGHRFEDYIPEFLFLLVMNILYLRYLQPGLDVFLTRDAPRRDGMLLKLLSGRVLEYEGASLQSLLDHVVEALVDSMAIQGGRIVAQDRFRNTRVSHRPATEDKLFAALKRLLGRIGTRRLGEEILNVFDGIFLIERNNRSPDALRIEEFLFYMEKYPTIRRTIMEVFGELRKARSQLFIPLILDKKILGFLILGEQSGNVPYFDRELDLLRNLRATIALAIRNHNNQQELRTMKNHAEAELEKLTEYISRAPGIKETIHGRTLVYKSRLMHEVLEHTRRMSTVRERPILILGETGTGKELMARLIHENRNPKEPFIAVNCAAIPESLWESEIFGHAGGAFTDAKHARAGRVQEAGAGTLFFDEVGEMPLQMQSRLLRLLQERVYTPLGAVGEMQSQCNFIFATNRDLDEMVVAGTFREDLFFRINVLRLKLPPLRERREDIPVLVMHFIEKIGPELGCKVEKIEDSAMNALIDYHWPGNIRELENILIRVMAGEENLVLSRAILPPLIGRSPPDLAVPAPAGGRAGSPGAESVSLNALQGNFRDLVQDYRAGLIRLALKNAGGNRTHAAKFLGLNRTTLTAQIAELGIDATQFKK